MAPQQGVRLNRAAVGRVLKSPELAALANGVAHDIAGAAGPNAIVEEYTTDRGAAAVMVPVEDQALHGALTRAAADRGFPVSGTS